MMTMPGRGSGEIFIELEKELRQLPGVINMELARDKSGNLLFIHFLISQADERQQQQLLERVIECGRKRQVNITAEQVTLALLGLQATQKDGVRTAIEGIFVRREKNMFEAEVRLDCCGIKYTGKHAGIDISPLRLRIVAEAALNAIQKKLGEEVRLSLIGVKKIIIEETEMLVMLVAVLISGREVKFAGCSLSENGDEIQAAVKAVLAALNRYLSGSLLI